MHFSMTADQEKIRKETRNFAEREICPHHARLRKKEFPWDIYQKMVEAGLAGAIIPEQYGGAGLSTLSFAIMTIEICRADAGIGLSIGASQSLVAKPLTLFGNEEQKKSLASQNRFGRNHCRLCSDRAECGI